MFSCGVKLLVQHIIAMMHIVIDMHMESLVKDLVVTFLISNNLYMKIPPFQIFAIHKTYMLCMDDYKG